MEYIDNIINRATTTYNKSTKLMSRLRKAGFSVGKGKVSDKSICIYPIPKPLTDDFYVFIPVTPKKIFGARAPLFKIRAQFSKKWQKWQKWPFLGHF